MKKIIILLLSLFPIITFSSEMGRYHEVIQGESLSKIALEEYGSYNKWPDLHRWNAQISNPDLIYYGEKIFIPTIGNLDNPQLNEKDYDVSVGDTYKSISTEIFGLDKRWKAIAKWNNHRELSGLTTIKFTAPSETASIAASDLEDDEEYASAEDLNKIETEPSPDENADDASASTAGFEPEINDDEYASSKDLEKIEANYEDEDDRVPAKTDGEEEKLEYYEEETLDDEE